VVTLTPVGTTQLERSAQAQRDRLRDLLIALRGSA
jgi:hypothetical protein